MNDFSSVLIYIGGGLIFISAFVLIIPYIKKWLIKQKIKKHTKKTNEAQEQKEEGEPLDCKEPNGVKINICNNSALTPEDEELRNVLFEKHIKHYMPEGSSLHDGKIPIPFEAIVFLTKSHAPIVNEDGEIIVTLNKSDEWLVVEEKEKASFLKSKQRKSESVDLLSEITKPSSDEVIIDKTTEKSSEKEQLSKNQEKKEDNTALVEKTARPAIDDGFLTVSIPQKKESFIKEVPGDTVDDVMNQALEDIEGEGFAGEIDIIPFEEDDEAEDDLFKDDDIEESNSSNEEYDYKNLPAVEMEAIVNNKLPDSKAEAEAIYAKEFIETSLALVDNTSIIGSTMDLDDALDAMDDNQEKCQEVFIRNLFAINGVGITTPDKIVMISRLAIAKAASVTLTQINGVQIAIYKHLISKQGMKDTLNMIRFITSNPEFVISDPNRPFEFLAFEREDGEVCKDNVIKISSVFIEEIFGNLGSIIMKYPPKTVKVTSVEAEKFCEN